MSDTHIHNHPHAQPKKYFPKAQRWVSEHPGIVLAAGTLLVLKYDRLSRENHQLRGQLREAKRYVDDARVQLEALSLFDQVFGRQKQH